MSQPVGGLRHVASDLGFTASDDVVLVVALAPAPSAGELVAERLHVTSDGNGPQPVVTELAGSDGSRMHVVRAGAGDLLISYAATVRAAEPPAVASPGTDPDEVAGGLVDADAITALRQSRFCPSDALAGFAAGEFGGLEAGTDLARAVAAWVFERIAYEPGSSGPLDTSVDTLLSGAGVCRDFAHLTIALCRALGVPARLAAVYAPGLSPMDFHAVVEVRRGGRWEVHDPTRLAPRTSLVRIATGRDASDTAFATTLSGTIELTTQSVFAVVEGDLPLDDHVEPVALA
ncbi:MAG TPA: transglutaminase family protein [Solirubrobacteraceae bacterium]